MDLVLIIGVIVAIVMLIGWSTGVRIINHYERGVVFRLGKLIRPKGPGLRFIIPFGIDRLIKVDLRVVTLEVPPQEAITVDNVTVSVLAVVYFQVVSPTDAVTRVMNYYNATSQLAQSTLRSVMGQSSLHDLLADRQKLNGILQRIVDEQTEPWGIKVTSVEIKDVELPESMQRAMARQAEAEREKMAKIINAEGELEAAGKLTQAAQVISQEPAALQLRYLQTLAEIGVEQNTMIVFPLPIELIQPLIDLKGRKAEAPRRPLFPGTRPTGKTAGMSVDPGATAPADPPAETDA
jgi:regulator of protease activity HflC (stomatin/prohibitin superfamily)